MEELRSVPLFESFKIIWEEGKESPLRVRETMIITNNRVNFIRMSVNELTNEDPYSNINCKWSFKTDDIEFETALNAVCLYFLNHMEPTMINNKNKYSYFTIEVKKYNEKKLIKKSFLGHLRDYEYGTLLDLLEGFIPNHIFVPYFIEDYSNV